MEDKERNFVEYLIKNYGEEAYRQYCRYLSGCGSISDFLGVIEAGTKLPPPEEFTRWIK